MESLHWVPSRVRRPDIGYRYVLTKSNPTDMSRHDGYTSVETENDVIFYSFPNLSPGVDQTSWWVKIHDKFNVSFIRTHPWHQCPLPREIVTNEDLKQLTIIFRGINWTFFFCRFRFHRCIQLYTVTLSFVSNLTTCLRLLISDNLCHHSPRGKIQKENPKTKSNEVH